MPTHLRFQSPGERIDSGRHPSGMQGSIRYKLLKQNETRPSPLVWGIPPSADIPDGRLGGTPRDT